MESKKVLILCFSITIFDQMIASDAQDSPSWKVSFFTGYMKEYSALGSTSHEAIAGVLQNSFDQAAAVAPEEDQHLVDSVRGQVAYFVGLQDEEEKAQELQKCQEGMKQATSVWARLAPDAVKAHFFVSKFVEESQKRQK